MADIRSEDDSDSEKCLSQSEVHRSKVSSISRWDRKVSDGEKRTHDEADEEEEEDIDGVAIADAAPKKQKISIGFNKTFGSIKSDSSNEKKAPAPITIKLGAQKTKDTKFSLNKASASVASVFNQDSDEEEMPPEAKMRMRNIGRDTPTSAGPNSFGKTRHGFCDSKKVFERQLKKKMEEVSDI